MEEMAPVDEGRRNELTVGAVGVECRMSKTSTTEVRRPT